VTVVTVHSTIIQKNQLEHWLVITENLVSVSFAKIF